MPFFTALAISFLLSSMALLTADFTTKYRAIRRIMAVHTVYTQKLNMCAAESFFWNP